jgi:hypothetical protein
VEPFSILHTEARCGEMIAAAVSCVHLAFATRQASMW